MPTLLSGRAHAALAALLALAAAAPAAHAQQSPRWQLEASLDATGPNSYYSAIADGVDGGFTLKQEEAVRYSVGAARLVRVTPRVSVRLGLSLSNKGFEERTETPTETTVNHVDLLYLGTPLTLGYNVVNGNPGLKAFAEAGLVPEVLLRQDESEFGLNLRAYGVSWLAGFGVKYNLGDGRAVTIGPEARFSLGGYTWNTPNTTHFHPQTVGLKLGLQF